MMVEPPEPGWSYWKGTIAAEERDVSAYIPCMDGYINPHRFLSLFDDKPFDFEAPEEELSFLPCCEFLLQSELSGQIWVQSWNVEFDCCIYVTAGQTVWSLLDLFKSISLLVHFSVHTSTQSEIERVNGAFDVFF